MPSVKQVMNSHVLTVGPDETLERGAQLMFERKVGSAMVVKGSDFVGIVTERDVLRAVAHGRVPWTTRVEEVMTADPICVPPDTELIEAIRIMIDGGFRHLPIMDQGNLVGLVSLREMLRSTALPALGLKHPTTNASLS
ncbi:MAG: CBS domain-containing protein [Actinomycetota bacterium]|nr:CBS domain-containing protein [Actinomycetota bacterium]